MITNIVIVIYWLISLKYIAKYTANHLIEYCAGKHRGCILLSTNTCSPQPARFPQISRSGLPDVNCEQNSHFDFAYSMLITYFTQQTTFELFVNKY